jgi:hypothetical protein
MMKLITNRKGGSVAFAIFVMAAVIVVYAILQMAVGSIMQEVVIQDNRYWEENPEKFVPEIYNNQKDAFRFYEAFTFVVLLTLTIFIIKTSIKRSWEEKSY